jgi:hypothetical protein
MVKEFIDPNLAPPEVLFDSYPKLLIDYNFGEHAPRSIIKRFRIINTFETHL